MFRKNNPAPQRTLRGLRWGRVRRRFVRQVLSADEMPEKQLMPSTLCSKFIRSVYTRKIVDAGVEAGRCLPSLSSTEYLGYCRICYEAAFGVPPGQLPTSLYLAFADGRHGGLLTLRGTSAAAFRRWYDCGLFLGSHPFEIVRDSIVLSVHAARGSGFRLRLCARRHDFVTPWLIAMAVGLVEAGVPFEMLNVRGHVLFAAGHDWIGVADENTWLGGPPVWPDASGILNTVQNSFTTSELSPHREVFRRIRWFRTGPVVQPL